MQRRHARHANICIEHSHLISIFSLIESSKCFQRLNHDEVRLSKLRCEPCLPATSFRETETKRRAKNTSSDNNANVHEASIWKRLAYIFRVGRSNPCPLFFHLLGSSIYNGADLERGRDRGPFFLRFYFILIFTYFVIIIFF